MLLPQIQNLGSMFQQQQFQQQQFLPRYRVRSIPQCLPQSQTQSYITVQDSTHIFTQVTPAAVWTINHNLGQFPSVTLVDTSGNVVLAQVQYINSNQIVVTFSQPLAGNAYLNV